MASNSAVNPDQDWPTTMMSRMADGRCVGVDKSVWLYRKVQLAPVVDASSSDLALEAMSPIGYANDEIGELARSTMGRRNLSRSSYRKVHLLVVDVPQAFSAPPDSPIRDWLNENYGTTNTQRRLLLMGVKLTDKADTSGGFHSVVDYVSETLSSGLPLSAFDTDAAGIDAILSRYGMVTPTTDDFRLANAWWNHGRFPDTPMMSHGDHLHIWNQISVAERSIALGKTPCETWPEMPNHHTLAMATIQDFDLPFVDQEHRAAQWVAALLDEGAAMVSIRGLVEPPTVTRGELRRNRKRYTDDIIERQSQGKMDRLEQEEMLRNLTDMEANYSGGGPSTLVDASVICAFPGRDALAGYDVTSLGRRAGVVLNSMAARQLKALRETMLCSNVRSSPHLHDIPSHVIAASGINSLSLVGDGSGALVGFTERDRQPAYLSPFAASDEDQLPITVVAAQSGAGKTVFALHLANQFARIRTQLGENTPVVFIDPKLGSDHSAAVEASGGQVVSLDELVSADGIFDPIRFAADPQSGVELAASMLMSVNPWGSALEDYQTPLTAALAWGVRNGATCTGEALLLALRGNDAPKPMVDRAFDLAESSPLFRACMGVNPKSRGLRVSGGITLIKVGGAHLNLPSPGATQTSQPQKVALTLVRMMVYGSAMALTGRQGVLMLDEGWVILGAGQEEVERLGRLARSQQVLPMIFTQRMTDLTNAGLSGYISRGIILPFKDRAEARAAFETFKLEPTAERLDRITAPDTIGDGAEAAPNWSSMRALHRPGTREVLRGSVAIYVDLRGRAIPVEITIPPGFLARSSTSPEDIRRRQAARAT